MNDSNKTTKQTLITSAKERLSMKERARSVEQILVQAAQFAHQDESDYYTRGAPYARPWKRCTLQKQDLELSNDM